VSLPNVPIATDALSDSGRSEAAMSAKPLLHRMGLQKSQVTACRTVAKIAVKQLRSGAGNDRIFSAAASNSNTTMQHDGTRRMITATASVVDSLSGSHKQDL
jgi:hypothetical protein